jgi:hypothetical protein
MFGCHFYFKHTYQSNDRSNKILFLFFLTLIHCKGLQLDNSCDPNSKNFQEANLAKASGISYENFLLSRIVTGKDSTVCSSLSNQNSNFPTSPPTIAFDTSTYTLSSNTPISNITPVISGNPTSCTASPTLPTGLSINATTCVISGTPLNPTSKISYSIVASNSLGQAGATISISVLGALSSFLGRTSANETNTWSSVTYANGQYVAVADSGTNRVMTSPDGVTWTA